MTETANETLGKYRHKKQPWVTPDIFHLCNKRRELKKDKFTTEGAKQYKAVNQHIKKRMVKARETWIEERCQEIDDSLGKNNSKKAYQLVKNLTSSKQGRTTTIQDKNGKHLTEEKDILNRWTEYCSELYNHKAKGDPEVLKHPPMTNTHSHPILREEVEAAVKSLKPGKSAGVDNIPAELLQAGGETMIDVLLNICNKIWQTGEWPTPWTQSLVITLPKKGNLLQCQNYRTISLISHASKVILKILLNRLTPQAETIIAGEQAGCRPGRSTTEQIFSLRILCERYRQHQQDLFHVFVDFKKAFDRVWHAALWPTMKLYNINANLIKVIENLYSKATSAVYYNGSVGEWFRTTVGVRQGCLLSPTLFNIFLERIMTDALENHEGSVSIGGRTITNLRFADIDALAGKEDELVKLINHLDTSTKYGMEISAEKTKLMTNNIKGISLDVRIVGQKLETVQSFKYLGSVVTDEGSKQEILSRIAQNNWCIDKAQDHMERQEHCTKFQNQTDAILGHLNFPVRLRDMDPHSRVREKDTNYRNEMLSKTLGHLLQRSCYKWGSGEQNQTSHWALWRSSHHCEETKTEMVWAQNKINRTCKDDPTGHCTRREKKRQTEKEMGRQRNGMDRLKLGEALRKAENREEWRTVVARSPLVPQRSTRLWDKRSVKVKWCRAQHQNDEWRHAEHTYICYGDSHSSAAHRRQTRNQRTHAGCKVEKTPRPSDTWTHESTSKG